jgi:pyruvate dehydrogenase E2 component (dihydrolipoamide acetyltransferase)
LRGELLQEVPLRGIRGVISHTMTNSLREMAQLTLHRTVDVTQVEAFRVQHPGEFSINDVVSAAVVRALRKAPRVNATLEDGVIKEWSTVNLGVAVALEQGLVVPVIRDAQQRDLRQLGAEIRRLASLAKSGGLAMSEIEDGTFTVTNLGAFGIDYFTPIIHPPQVAILGIGCVRNGEAALSLTIDHRAVDGAPGAQFLAQMSKELEEPELLLARPRANL